MSVSARSRASGIAAAVVVSMPLLLAARAHRAAGGTIDPAAQSPFVDAAVVCVGSDGVLRASGTGGTCTKGQSSLPLSTGAVNCDDCDPWNPKDDPNPGPASAVDGLGALESKVAAIEKSPLFAVLDQNGQVMFEVRPGKVVLHNSAGNAVVSLGATETGGFLTANSVSGSLASSIGASGNAGGVLITEGGLRRVEFGKQPAGNISLLVLRETGPIAAVGESQVGTGALIVADAAGRLRAAMSIVDGKGSSAVHNADGETVLAMTEGATTGGLLAVGDATSEPMVKFGVNQDRYGVVLTGPVAGFPLVPDSGLPGSYILGCAAGAACSPGGGGQSR